MTTPLRVLASALLLVSPCLASPQQTFVAASGPKLSQVQKNIGDSPQLIYWNGSGGGIVRVGWATADRGVLNVYARSEHHLSATFQSDTTSYASFEIEDVVFSSAGSGSVTVGVHMTIDGEYFMHLGNGLNVSASFNGSPLGSASVDAQGVTSSGLLSGYSMLGEMSFTKPISVPLNTPVTLSMRMDVYSGTSLQGYKNWGSYSLRLGHDAAPGPDYLPFDLPPGVTVDSPALGVVDGVWEYPSDVHLFAGETQVGAGESLQLTAWNQPAGAPVGILYSWGPPTPPLAFSTRLFSGLNGVFDSKGWYSPAAIDHQPWLSGLQLTARPVTLGPDGLLLGEKVQVEFL